MKLDQNYRLYSPNDYAEALPHSQFMDFQIKPLWSPIPRISGAAFTVKLAPSDKLPLLEGMSVPLHKKREYVDW